MLVSTVIAIVSTCLSIALWIKFKAANHTARTLLDKLKITAEDLDETKRLLASTNLTLDTMQIERSQSARMTSLNGHDPNHSPEKKKRKYYRRPKGQ